MEKEQVSGTPGSGPGGAERQITADHQPTPTKDKEVVSAEYTPDRPKTIRPRSKRYEVLSALLELGDKGMTRFLAEYRCGDHCLPSTVSELCADFCLQIPRELITVPGRHGNPTQCALYRLSSSDRDKVRQLLQLEAEAAS